MFSGVLYWLLVGLAPPQAELTTLRGERFQGPLVELTESGALLRQEGQERLVPLAEILDLRLESAAAEPAVGPRVLLVDGTRLTCRDVTIEQGVAQFEPLEGSRVSVPVNRLLAVRFGHSTARLDEAWDALLKRESKNDLLVIRKEDQLDFLSGAAGDLAEKISFLVDGEEIPVARDKVYGLILRRKAPALAKVACQVGLTAGDQLCAASVQLDEQSLRARLCSGVELTLPATRALLVDFSAGKVRYLSATEPREVKYVPFFDLVREYRRDRSLDGTPLSLAGKTYARGLALHSRTLLKYRIGGEYSRFQALAGIDDSVRRLGQVRLLITGDGKTLFDAEIKGVDAPRVLDLEVTGVRDLEILVDFGGDQLDIADHLDLADARLIR
jgi:hypothetical protein